MTNRFRRFSENSRGGFSGNRSTLLRPSFFSERSFTRFWRLGFARSLTDQQSYEAIEYLLHAADGPPDFGKKHDKLLFRAQFFYFMGEVEAVFGVWLIPLFLAIIAFQGWSTMVDYVGNVNVADAVFVVVIMAMASSLPIIRFTETVIAKVSAIGNGTPASWWLTILTLGPLLGSFITGPAAMTICALLLRHRFYSLKPSERLKYATLGLLFVNISVGGVLTQFAYPPVEI